MDFLLSFFFYSFLCISIIFLCLICVCDADLTLTYFDKFGKKNKNDSLRNSVIWITGASSGIGAACAVEAAKSGYKIVLTARNENFLQNIKKKCLYSGLKEENILVLPADLTDFSCHRNCIDRVLERFGRIDVMLHNAGRSQRACWSNIEIGVDYDIFELNVFSVIHLSRLLIPEFERQGRGQFVIMSSVAGCVPIPYSSSYSASKYALHGYFEALRLEKTNIDVTLVCPGPTFSNLLEAAATEKRGESLNESMKPTDKRMSSARCARLTMVAMRHKLSEAWIAFFPVLPYLYFGQYAPTITKWIIRNFVAGSFFAKIRDSKKTK